MLSRSLSSALRLAPRRIVVRISAKHSTSAGAEPVSTFDRDPAPYFFNNEIQKLLKTITRPVPEKVFRKRVDGSEPAIPLYKFMTDEELKDAIHEAEKRMWRLMQMPPVVQMRRETSRVLSKDPALQGLETCNLVYTDITYGVRDADRMIVVREPDGILRTAYNEERDRMNQIFFPMKYRELSIPRMFQDEYLKPILDREDYEFILNRACIQFDPDHPDFQRITQKTYDCVNERMHFDRLRSTRHYGPMVFYLAWIRNIDKLLMENIQTERIEDAALAIRLYYKLNPSDKAIEDGNHINLINHFIETEKREGLNRALQMYLEIEAERRKIGEHTGKMPKMKEDNSEN